MAANSDCSNGADVPKQISAKRRMWERKVPLSGPINACIDYGSVAGFGSDFPGHLSCIAWLESLEWHCNMCPPYISLCNFMEMSLLGLPPAKSLKIIHLALAALHSLRRLTIP